MYYLKFWHFDFLKLPFERLVSPPGTPSRRGRGRLAGGPPPRGFPAADLRGRPHLPPGPSLRRRMNWEILQFFLQNFANFWRARSRLYQNEILQ